MILGAVWPRTDPEMFERARDAQHAKGVQLLESAEELRSIVQSVSASQSGEFVDAFCRELTEIASTFTSQADDGYFPMARATEEGGRLAYGLREDLDQIDLDAHEEIEQLEQEFRGSAAELSALVMGIVTQARATAMTTSTTATAAMTALTTHISAKAGQNGNPSSGNPPVAQPAGNPGDQDLQGLKFGGGGRGPGQFPASPILGGPRPDKGPSGSPQDRLSGDGGLGGNKNGTTSTSGQGQAGAQGTPEAAAAASNGGSNPPAPGDRLSKGINAEPRRVPAPPAVPAGLSSDGGESGGFKMPSGMGGMQGLGGGGIPTGLPSGGMPGGGLPGGGMPGGPGSMAPPAMSAPPSPLSTDFSKGFNAGLGAGGAPTPAVPPVQSAPAPATAAPAGAAPVGPAPVSAAAGSPAATPMVSAPAAVSGAPVAGGTAMPASMGPLPPFGSDAARSASIGAGAATVSPASGGGVASPASAAGAGGGGGPVTPLPPGVLGSGMGASASVATEGVRSSLPDPLLESATRLLHQLLRDSKDWEYVDWCVGVFHTPSGVETVIVNSDGLGYIPVGMFVPRNVRLLFTDPDVTEDFRSRWFAWANPAETMLAYAEIVNRKNPNVDLWALSVSTGFGGSATPARAAGVVHFDEVSRSDLKPDLTPSPLDDAHEHRLETLDRAQYVRTAGFGDMPKPNVSEAWRTTQTAVHVVLERLGAVLDFETPPVIREVMDALREGVPVRETSWEQLKSVLQDAAVNGSALRPGWLPDDGPASGHVRAHHDVSRLAELLLLWSNATMAHAELSYLVLMINRTPLAA